MPRSSSLGFGGLIALIANNTISGNYIGTNAAGTGAVGNTLQGVQIDAGSANIIGGTVAGAGNVISGNLDNGILITNGGVNNYVQGNIVGLDASGNSVLANAQEGIEVAGGASGTWIGGTTSATRNIISGNTWQGIGIYGATTDGTVIRGNWIGVAADGTTARGNEKQSILVMDATNTMIGGSSAGEGNIVANAAAGHQGIVIYGTATGAVIIGNSIYANSSLGIDVGGDWITTNDAGDADTGANNLQNRSSFVLTRAGGPWNEISMVFCGFSSTTKAFNSATAAAGFPVSILLKSRVSSEKLKLKFLRCAYCLTLFEESCASSVKLKFSRMNRAKIWMSKNHETTDDFPVGSSSSFSGSFFLPGFINAATLITLFF